MTRHKVRKVLTVGHFLKPSITYPAVCCRYEISPNTTTGLEDSSLSKDKFIGASIRTNDGANDADPDEEAIEDTP